MSGSAADDQMLVTTDAYHLAKAIRFAAVMIAIALVALGVLIWQPWAKPSFRYVPTSDGSTYGQTCVTYKDAVSCQW